MVGCPAHRKKGTIFSVPLRETLSLASRCNRSRPRRCSILSTQMNVLLAIGSLLAVETTDAIQPVKQPLRIEPRSASAFHPGGTRHPVSPDEDIHSIMHGLETVEDLEKFLHEHTIHKNEDVDAGFFETYRQDPEDFQAQGWKGPCNNFAEFTAHWAYCHGGTPYIVSLCPKGVVPKCTDSWHQVTVCKMEDGRLLIFNNEIITWWNGTLDDYIEKKFPTFDVFPFGGVIEWKLAQNNFRAKAAQHFVPNETEMKESSLPFRRSESRHTAPLT